MWKRKRLQRKPANKWLVLLAGVVRGVGQVAVRAEIGLGFGDARARWVKRFIDADRAYGIIALSVSAPVAAS
jgi:hypothetical protein